MEIALKLVESSQQIEQLIVTNLVKELDKIFFLSRPYIEARVKTLILDKLYSSPTVQDMFGGKLQGELGVVDPHGKLLEIFKFWTDSVYVKYIKLKAVSGKITGGYSIVGIDMDWSEVIRQPAAWYVTEKGADIYWLQWLLEKGQEFIIKDHIVSFNIPPKVYSRTGIAIMRVAQNTSWRVPKEHSGVQDDNFVTRALKNVNDEVIDIIQSEIEKRIF